jgi:hypothetical protein
VVVVFSHRPAIPVLTHILACLPPEAQPIVIYALPVIQDPHPVYRLSGGNN